MQTEYFRYVATLKKQAYLRQELRDNHLTIPWYRPLTKVLGKLVRNFWALC